MRGLYYMQKGKRREHYEAERNQRIHNCNQRECQSVYQIPDDRAVAFFYNGYKILFGNKKQIIFDAFFCIDSATCR